MRRRRGRMTVVGLVLLVLALGAATGVVLRRVGRAREAANRSVCLGHLFSIHMALRNYHEVHGAFPPAVVTDPRGRPLHSWRVLVLPYLGLEHRGLYDAYNFAQPWDGPDDRPLQAAAPAPFVCPSHQGHPAASPFTSYVAVTGPGTLWGRPLSAFPGTREHLLLLVETTADVPWTAPIDLPAGAIRGAMGRPTPDLPLPDSAHHDRGFHASYVDGRTRWVPLVPGWRERLAEGVSARPVPAPAEAQRTP